MRKFVAIVFSISITGGWGWFFYQKQNESAPAFVQNLQKFKTQGVPEFEAKLLNSCPGQGDAEKFSLYGLKHPALKGVVLHFWASYCEPCVTELPELLEAVHNHKNTVLVLVSLDDTLQELNNFFKNRLTPLESFKHLNTCTQGAKRLYSLWDPQKRIARLYGTVALPESFAISPQFLLLRKYLGAHMWNQPADTLGQFFNTASGL